MSGIHASGFATCAAEEYARGVALRDLFRGRRRRGPDRLQPLTEADVSRLQRVQRARVKTVRVVKRRRS